MDTLDTATNFPYNLLVVSLSNAYPLLGAKAMDTIRALHAREISQETKRLIDRVLLPSVSFFECQPPCSMKRVLDSRIIPLFSGLKKVFLPGFVNSIDDNGLRLLTSIEVLHLHNNRKITDESLKYLVNLRELDLWLCTGVTGECFPYLTNLKTLRLAENTDVSNYYFRQLSGLEELDLSYNARIGNKDIDHLSGGLRSLWLRRNCCVTGDCVANMTRLENLTISQCCIKDSTLCRLTTLKHLDLKWNRDITDAGISTLTRLTSLNISENKNITTEGLSPFMHSLREIGLSFNKTINRSFLLSHCPKLESMCDEDGEH